MSNHPIVHIEFLNSDPEATAKFYSELFGWELERSPMPGDMEGEYLQGLTGSTPDVAYPQADGEFSNPGDVLVYVYSDDVAATLVKVESLGGTVVVPESEIPGVGWFGVFLDPTGARVALLKTVGGQ